MSTRAERDAAGLRIHEVFPCLGGCNRMLPRLGNCARCEEEATALRLAALEKARKRAGRGSRWGLRRRTGRREGWGWKVWLQLMIAVPLFVYVTVSFAEFLGEWIVNGGRPWQ